MGGLGDEVVREAVREFVSRPRRFWRRTPAWAGTAVPEVTGRWDLAGFRVERLVETRTERERPTRKPGSVDLSALPRYTSLALYKTEPATDLGSAPRTWNLVREGSEREEGCVTCSDGWQKCPHCGGSGVLDCRPCDAVKCAACEATTPCTACGGSGDRKERPRRVRLSEEDRRRRTRCGACGRSRAACPVCAGHGRAGCARCDRSQVVDCAKCENGIRRHKECEGTGRWTVYREASIRWDRTDPERIHWPSSQEVPERVRRQASARGSWRTTRLVGEDPALPAELTDGTRAAIAARLRPVENELLQEASVRTMPMARATVAQDRRGVYYVWPGGAGRPEVVRVPARRWAGLSAGLLACAVLVVVVVVAAALA
ncbi:hypothetical protein [Streptomyces abyssomicinicus]|uniref:hypothetical protein n=1 Tax=Streptomyces abyssomicinicus TaxID=574929 RepID=UPI00124FDE2B|nr:hypothetical protein [Streptomyces abyssomicinicus]